MVDVSKLLARMALKGYSRRALAAEMTERGVKISENTLGAKLLGRSKFDCEDADVICEILGLETPDERAEIFLA